MAIKKSWLIAYDICNPKQLGRVHRLLKKEAIPIQYSIFYYEGTVLHLKRLMRDIGDLINNKTDDVRAYQIPEAMNYFSVGQAALPDGVSYFSGVSRNHLDLLRPVEVDS